MWEGAGESAKGSGVRWAEGDGLDGTDARFIYELESNKLLRIGEARRKVGGDVKEGG